MSAVTGVSTSLAAYRAAFVQKAQPNPVQGKASEEQSEGAAEKAAELTTVDSGHQIDTSA